MAEATAVRAVMLGAPGSGKGTQAELLARMLLVPAISTGEMLRQAVAEKSDPCITLRIRPLHRK